MKNKGVLFVVSSAIIFGIAPVFASMSYNYGNTPLSMVFFRNLLSIPIFVFLVKRNNLNIKIGKKNFINIIIISLFGSFVTSICLYKAYTYIGVGTTTTIHFMYPLIVCLINRIVYGEKMGIFRSLCLGICIFGVSFFIDISDIANIKGIVIAFISSISYSFYILYLEKKKLIFLHPYVFCLYLCVIVAFFILVYSLFVPSLVMKLPFIAYCLILISSVGTSYVASVLFNLGVKEIGSSKTAIFSLFEPISGVLFGIIMLDETINTGTIMGCILLLIGISGLSIHDMRTKNKN